VAGSTVAATLFTPAAAIDTMAQHTFALMVTIPEQTKLQKYLWERGLEQESLLKTDFFFLSLFCRW